MRQLQCQPTARINPWYAFKASGAPSYIAGSLVLLSLSIALSIYSKSWSWVSRAGGVLVLFGVLLSLRRLFRLGPQNLDEPMEPVVVDRGQFNIKYMHQSIHRLTDNFAQTLGVTLMVVGTVIAFYGDVLLDFFLPLK